MEVCRYEKLEQSIKHPSPLTLFSVTWTLVASMDSFIFATPHLKLHVYLTFISTQCTLSSPGLLLEEHSLVWLPKSELSGLLYLSYLSYLIIILSIQYLIPLTSLPCC